MITKSRKDKAVALITEQANLDLRTIEIDIELEKLFGNESPVRRGSKKGSKRKTKAKKKTSARKTKAKAKGSGRRSKSKDGRSINDVLIQSILPAKGKDGMSLSEVCAALKKAKVDTVDATVRQSLIKLVAGKKVVRPERGLHTLSAAGMKAKDKAKAPAKAKKKAPVKKAAAKKAAPKAEPEPAKDAA